mgnify:CR=1 FL=1
MFCMMQRSYACFSYHDNDTKRSRDMNVLKISGILCQSFT